MESGFKALESYGLAGIVIFGLVIVIWKYMLPSFQRIADTNERQAESLVEVSHTLSRIHNDITSTIPDRIESMEKKVLEAVERNKV